MDINNPLWTDLLLGKIQVKLNFLAGTLVLLRGQHAIKRNSAKEVFDGAKQELFDVYFRICPGPTGEDL